ncbi:hypothetical protein SAMN02949497_1919 [Methylomagnum ishizawai]|uniref:Uncharacterized protein n=1 Tax=Methylomagnum ishizawai TaxID=1760988 RepID=A0A1Y6CVD8_9GAMM|nr:hypothetical protein [Methylomagnum ishizawai]SMF94598.1 hypothetical protein SAMN02949497_1919 [Methylomagnum ishizawai]
MEAGEKPRTGQVESRLAQIRAMFRERGFDPIAVVIEEIQAGPRVVGGIVMGLSASETVSAALGVAKLEAEWEKIELAKNPPAGKRGGARVTVNPDGSVQTDIFADLESISDEQLEQRIARRQEALGIVGAG